MHQSRRTSSSARVKRTARLVAALVTLGLTATACGAHSAAGAGGALVARGAHSQVASSGPATHKSGTPAGVPSAPAANAPAGSAAVAAPLQIAANAVVASNGSEFDSPSGLAVAHNALWVANLNGNSLSEINPSNGDWLRNVRGVGYGFNRPTGIAADGSYLFIANAGGSVTEVNAVNGAAVRIIQGSQYHFADPVAILVTDGGAIVVVLNGGGSLTEFGAGSGGLIRVVSGAAFGFDNPVAMALSSSGAYAFVANRTNSTVTEVNVMTGALARIIRGDGLDSPDGIAVSSTTVWVSDSADNAVTKLSASSGAGLGTFSNSTADYGFGQPGTVFANAGNVFITSPFGVSPMVTKVSTTTNAPAWYMCNTNGPYYFSVLTALAATGTGLWVASSSGANNPKSDARFGSLTELSTTNGALMRTLPIH
jgi:hypothetical protein